jgi:hypothetical protein
MSLRDFAELASAPIPFAKVPLGASSSTNPNLQRIFLKKQVAGNFPQPA